MQNLAKFKSTTRIHFGPGAVNRLGDLVRDLGGQCILLVADRGLMAAGHVEKAQSVLKSEGLEVFLFHDFEENPTSRMSEQGAVQARDNRVDFIVGLGGGSSMDCAKAINFLVSNGGRITDYRGYGKADKPMLPMIGIPTTAGTGSETQSYALISDDESHRKMACGDPKAAFRAAVLDPELTLTLPASLTAATGFDAIGHAVETYVTTKRSEMSQFFSLEAWRLLKKNYARVLKDPGNLQVRGDMLLGSCLAGVAIENSMLGATHALANPLTQRYGTRHGIAIALLLHHVVRWNSAVVGQLYEELLNPSDVRDDKGLAEVLQNILERSGLPTSLRELEVPREDFPVLARDSAEQWTAKFNPRPLTEADALALYEAAY